MKILEELVPKYVLRLTKIVEDVTMVCKLLQYIHANFSNESR